MGAVWQANRIGSAPDQPDPPTRGTPPPKRGRPLARRFVLLTTVSLLAGGGYAGWHEMQTSELQARWLSRYAASLDYRIEPGASEQVLFPDDGPFDRRLGYVDIPRFAERLLRQGFRIEAQARFSPALLEYSSRGFFVPYPEKPHAGLTLEDCTAAVLYANRYPEQLYADFESIPPLVAQSLLFIEDRGLLDAGRPRANPAVDWPRLTMAALSQIEKNLGLSGQAAGGSTLATQAEKYRHSPYGRTDSPEEKLRQMVSASVRTYREGPQTLASRQHIVLAYLNSVPLAAVPGHGEVHGLADGLRLWFGADFAEVNRLLDPRHNAGSSLAAQGLALRQVLSLLIAQRRPTHYLGAGRDELTALTDSHLRLLARDGLIPLSLRDAALARRAELRDFSRGPATQAVEIAKGVSIARTRLASLLGLSLYDLDRLDLTATTPLHGPLQRQVGEYLRRLADPAFAEEMGLFGDRMLSPEKTAEVRYSFTLLERDEQGFQVRVQTDSTDQPFDINQGSKLELGSTAKLRVLTTYLEVIAELHQRHALLDRQALRQVKAEDPLSRWALDYLARNEDRSLTAMLDAAMERRYSASPAERFFTGAGMHRFSNFRHQDDHRLPTLREALRESINLPFVRLLRDLVSYSSHQLSDRAALLGDDDNPERLEYLARFADREGVVFLQRFWKKYRDKNTEQRIEVLLDGIQPTPARLAAVHRYVLPEADRARFTRFLDERLPASELDDDEREALYQRYARGQYSLPDQGYIARVHPLDLWLLGYLIAHPDAGLKEIVDASAEQRQEVYGWLLRSRHKSARDSRIRIMLEIEAFTDIHRRWQRLGYPFEHLVPSLATALGSSGDQPAALAELMGIILNDGVRLPSIRIDHLRFASDTPYETHLGIATGSGERVLPREVAQTLREALANVVEGGTARRLQDSFTQVDGSALAMGGKTGTGDNRLQSVTASGRLISSRAINRTATFVFYLGPNHFGTLTAYVPGQAADNFRFTSALPVQALKGMQPILQPYLRGESLCQPREGWQQASAAPDTATTSLTQNQPRVSAASTR